MFKNLLRYNCYASNILCDNISYNKNGKCIECSKIITKDLTEDDLLKNYNICKKFTRTI
jgi:hypothetical protein